MSWLDSLDIPVSQALSLFPPQVNLATLTIERQQYLVAKDSLVHMVEMKLGHLPVSTVAMPKELSDLLTRPHEENLIRDVSHHLTDHFPNFFVAAIYEMQSLFAAQGLEAYIIGGITRDMLLSAERRYDIQDVDITVEGSSVEAARFIDEKSKNFGLIQAYEPFCTAKLDYKGQIEIDFASTRREIYDGCGHLPQVIDIGVPLDVDIIRRDFTINALALSIRNPGQVIDCTSGLTDLEARQIRLLKAESFFEDPSRIFRAFKFALRLGFHWAEDTTWLLDSFLAWMPGIYKGGGDRIRAELYSFLCQSESENKTRWFQMLADKGLHRLIDTHLPARLDLPLPIETMAQRLRLIQEKLAAYWTPELTWEIYVTYLLLGVPRTQAEPAMHRLELTRHEIEVVEKSFRLLDENVIYPLTPYTNPVLLYDTFHAYPMGAVCLGLLLAPDIDNCLAAYLHFKQAMENVKLEVTGDDVLNLGVPQGEQVGKLLKALFYAKLQGKVSNRVEEITWLKSAIDKQPEESRS